MSDVPEEDAAPDPHAIQELLKEAKEVLHTPAYTYIAVPTGVPEFPGAREALAPFQVLIADIATKWSGVEQILDGLIWQLADINPSLGLCLTAQLPSARARFRALIALHLSRGGDQATLRKITKLMGQSVAVSDRRNRAIHDPISYSMSKKCVMVNRFSADKELTKKLEPADIKWYQETSTAIYSITKLLIVLGNDIQKLIPELRLRSPDYLIPIQTPSVEISFQPLVVGRRDLPG